jgi:hypothetical protein
LGFLPVQKEICPFRKIYSIVRYGKGGEVRWSKAKSGRPVDEEQPENKNIKQMFGKYTFIYATTQSSAFLSDFDLFVIYAFK